MMSKQICCDFCDKTQREVELLITNERNNKHICDECIEVSIEILAKHNGIGCSTVYQYLKERKSRFEQRRTDNTKREGTDGY
jgi:ATP-dependent protease Clp ATPase subunit